MNNIESNRVQTSISLLFPNEFSPFGNKKHNHQSSSFYLNDIVVTKVFDSIGCQQCCFMHPPNLLVSVQVSKLPC